MAELCGMETVELIARLRQISGPALATTPTTTEPGPQRISSYSRGSRRRVRCQ